MSTLDELKKQASEVTQRNQVASSADVSEEQTWRKLAAVMKYLKDHFTELANTLNVLEKGTMVDFEINDSLTLKRLKGQNYKVSHPTAEKEKDWIFEFENFGEHPTYSVVTAGTAATNFKTTLADNQIKCVATPLKDNKSIKFEITSLVRTKYRFTVDLKKEQICLTISNYSSLWQQTNYLKKTEITTELMDELTRHVMREPNRYNEMVGNTISEEARTKLREKLKTDKNKKAAQTRQNETRGSKAKQQAKKDKTLFGGLFKKK